MEKKLSKKEFIEFASNFDEIVELVSSMKLSDEDREKNFWYLKEFEKLIDFTKADQGDEEDDIVIRFADARQYLNLKVSPDKEDLILWLIYRDGDKYKSMTIGAFNKQPDGMFDFEFISEKRKKVFSEVYQSKDQVKTFLEIMSRKKEVL
jgi:hypothetical protein